MSKQVEFEFAIGDKVQDKTTGLQGNVIAQIHNADETNQYLVVFVNQENHRSEFWILAALLQPAEQVV